MQCLYPPHPRPHPPITCTGAAATSTRKPTSSIDVGSTSSGRSANGGSGGGHKFACGSYIPKKGDFIKYLEDIL